MHGGTLRSPTSPLDHLRDALQHRSFVALVRCRWSIRVAVLPLRAVKNFPNRPSLRRGVRGARWLKKSSLPQAVAPESGKISGANTHFSVTLFTTHGALALSRRLGEPHRPHQIMGDRVPQCHCLHLIEPRTKNCISPRPRAMALTHSAVAARCL